MNAAAKRIGPDYHPGCDEYWWTGHCSCFDCTKCEGESVVPLATTDINGRGHPVRKCLACGGEVQR